MYGICGVQATTYLAEPERCHCIALHCSELIYRMCTNIISNGSTLRSLLLSGYPLFSPFKVPHFCHVRGL